MGLAVVTAGATAAGLAASFCSATSLTPVRGEVVEALRADHDKARTDHKERISARACCAYRRYGVTNPRPSSSV